MGDKYLLEHQLGRGGMGVVYRARHRITDRVVALKWLLEDNPQLRERFLREARAMGRLAHPNVVGVLDVGEHEGASYLVMEYLEGKSLRDFIDDGPGEPAAVISLFMPALSGVAAAHQAGILHRDLKPENLFALCDRDGTPYDTKVLDFGVAKPFGQNAAQASLTRSGAIVGTPKYMAPEQLGEEIELDPRCDVYALGLILYELLTGQLPYRSRALNALLLEILMGDARSPKELRPELPDALCEVVLKALARERDRRYADVASFAKALEPWGGGARFEAPRRVHTPERGETDPGTARMAREASVEAAPAPAATRSGATRSVRPPRPSSAEISGTEPTVEAPSVETSSAGAAPVARTGRASALAIAVVVGALVAAASAAIAFTSNDSADAEAPETALPTPASPPAPDPPAGDVDAPEPVEASPAPSEGGPPPDVAQPAPQVEEAGVEAPEEPAARAARPNREHRRPPPAERTTPPESEPAEGGVIRVRTRAGTLEAGDF